MTITPSPYVLALSGSIWGVSLDRHGVLEVSGNREACLAEFWQTLFPDPPYYLTHPDDTGPFTGTRSPLYISVTQQDDHHAFTIRVDDSGVVEFDGEIPEATKDFWRKLGQRWIVYRAGISSEKANA